MPTDKHLSSQPFHLRCTACLKPFRAMKREARFCSARCRLQTWRRLKREMKRMLEVKREEVEQEAIVKRYDDRIDETID